MNFKIIASNLFVNCFAGNSRCLQGYLVTLEKLNSTSSEIQLLQDTFVLTLLLVSATTALELRYMASLAVRVSIANGIYLLKSAMAQISCGWTEMLF